MYALHDHGRDVGEERAVRDAALHDSALASGFARTCFADEKFQLENIGQGF